MPKVKKDATKTLITRQEAEKLFPNEWVVFSEPTEKDDFTFKDGIVFFHGNDQAEAYEILAKVKGDGAMFYMGDIPYRLVSLTDASASDGR